MDQGRRLIEKSQGESGSLLMTRTLFKNPERREIETQTVTETSAPDSEKSGPRSDQEMLIKTINGMPHVLLTMSHGIKKMISEKARARKAHARRERRRAARQSEVENQPSQFPADSPLGLQLNVSTADIGKIPAEAGAQPPTKD
jgi:hypothetical protein